jgi:hypothetical protein
MDQLTGILVSLKKKQNFSIDIFNRVYKRTWIHHVYLKLLNQISLLTDSQKEHSKKEKYVTFIFI